MVTFTCNVCGSYNEVEQFATEPASCSCGSNVRIRALIHLLSLELFGHSIPLTKFPRLKAIRGLGMTDHEGYAAILAEKFDYTNTHYDRPPRFDFTEHHPELAGTYDFILSADVLEHIAQPVDRALEEVRLLLKPHGFFGITVYCNPADDLHEHFPDLYQYRLVPLGDSFVLVNRKRDGSLEITDDVIFHGGTGSTIEMRDFGITGLRAKLLAAGFTDLCFLTDNVPDIGVLFDHDVSQPLIARKAPFTMDANAQTQLIEAWHAAERSVDKERERADQLAEWIRLASNSRWLRLGRRLGLGPKHEAAAVR